MAFYRDWGSIMDWNYIPEIISICVLAVILVFHHKTIYVRTRRDKLFVRCIWTSIIAMLLNILSLIAIIEAKEVPFWLNLLINDLFFSFSPLIVVTFGEYWLYLVFEDTQQHAYYRFGRYYLYVFAALMVLGTVVNHFTPILYYFDENLQYRAGTAAFVPVVLVLSCIGVAAAGLILNKNNVQKSIRGALFAVPAVVAAIILIQQLLPGMQLIGTALMIGVLLIYLSFHSNSVAYDKLTDCLNKDSLYLALRRNYPLAPPRAFLMVTMSNYPVIRNEYGHQMMDELISAVSTYLKQVYGPSHTYRIGEDTFVCAMLEHVGIRCMEETYSHLNADWLVGGVLCRVDCAVACYEVLDIGMLTPDMLSYLKYAISKAENGGSHGVIPCNPELMAEYEREKQIALQLKEAIKNGAFSLFFDPICKVSDEKLSIVGADCGIGFRFAEGGSFSYEQILPVAERYNLLNPINELILQRACAFQRRLNTMGLGDILLFCEITQTQLRSESIISRLRNIIEDEHADPDRIKLQLGGQTVCIGLRVRENLELLYRSGIGVCLKDTGRSNLDDLLTTPFAYVKLDEAALFSMGLSSRLNAFFRLALSFFSQFGTTVIARNVISTEHILYLESHGIEYVQGAGVSAPLLEADFIVRLKAEREMY